MMARRRKPFRIRLDDEWRKQVEAALAEVPLSPLQAYEAALTDTAYLMPALRASIDGRKLEKWSWTMKSEFDGRKQPRKPGGGRKPVLTAAEIAQSKKQLRRGLKEDARLRDPKTAAKYVRPLLPEAKRDVSLDTLKRWILRPVLAKAK